MIDALFDFLAEITEKDGDIAKEIEKAMKELRETEVLVGIPEEEASREGVNGLTNVELLYIHSNGSPLQHIPARAVLEPAISDTSERIGSMLGEAMKKATDGDLEGMKAQLSKAGLAGQQAAQGWFTNPKNNWAPNADSVIEIKRSKGSTDPKPLIDTGELRKSITYVVRKKT